MFFGLTEGLKCIIHILKRETERLINSAKVTHLEVIKCQIQKCVFSKVLTLSTVIYCLPLKKKEKKNIVRFT